MKQFRDQESASVVFNWNATDCRTDCPRADGLTDEDALAHLINEAVIDEM